jgi:hypothetical protein
MIAGLETRIMIYTFLKTIPGHYAGEFCFLLGCCLVLPDWKQGRLAEVSGTIGTTFTNVDAKLFDGAALFTSWSPRKQPLL